LSSIYGFPPEYAKSQRDTQQYERITSEMSRNPQIKSLVERLESDYDARLARRAAERSEEPAPEPPSTTELPPSVEQFLRELDQPSSTSPGPAARTKPPPRKGNARLPERVGRGAACPAHT
ncbi:MAG: hypothetical protein IH869_06260, partial [Chloroflexi bacterium]|nr:hypothetical protein [Chloroflexota bacterium]